MRALGEVTNPTGRLPAKEFDNRFRFHTAAQRWAAGTKAETPTPDRQRPRGVVFSILEITTGRCRDWGRDVSVLHQAVFTSSRPGRGHRGHGLKFPAGNSSCCVSPAGGRQHRAGGSCCSTGPANLVGSPGAAGQMALPYFMPGECPVTLRAASIGEAAFLFPSAPAPRGGPGKSR